MNQSSASFLTVNGVTLRFAGVIALSDVSFSVEAGELFAIIGPNGAGKSSLLNVLTRIYTPVSGQVIYDNLDLLKYKAHDIAALGIGRTFQNLGQFPEMTVLDYLLLGRHSHMHSGFLLGGIYFGPTRREEQVNKAHCLDVLQMLGLAKVCHRPIGSLSYGQQKRVDLARALALQPRLLLLDEPVAGMGFEETYQLAEVLLDIKMQLGITQILIEHDMAMVMGIADRLLVLDFGCVIAQGAPEEIQSHPEVIRAYLGQELGTPLSSKG
jgi:branched-chain amino acid transport system ATP-binding protein